MTSQCDKVFGVGQKGLWTQLVDVNLHRCHWRVDDPRRRLQISVDVTSHPLPLLFSVRKKTFNEVFCLLHLISNNPEQSKGLLNVVFSFMGGADQSAKYIKALICIVATHCSEHARVVYNSSEMAPRQTNVIISC